MESELRLIPPKDLSKKFSQINWDKDGRPSLKNTNSVGIVKFVNGKEIYKYDDSKLFKLGEGNEIESTLIFDLIKYVLKDVEEIDSLSNALSYSTDEEIELAEGSFVDFIYPFFILELQKIVREGILKQYIRVEDNLLYLKGKINIKDQIKNEMKNNPRIASRYFDLTHNIFINQVILAAINEAIIRSSLPIIISKLVRLRNIFKQENIDEKQFSYHEITKEVQIPPKFQKAFILSKYILLHKHSKLKDEKKVICPSFLIYPEVVWESFLRSVIRNAFRDEPQYRVEKLRGKMKIFDGGLYVSEEPDILISKNQNILYVIDAKYKQSRKNSDLYQIAAYLGSANIKNKSDPKVKGFLFYLGKVSEYEENEEIIKGDYILSQDEKLPLRICFLYKKLIESDIIDNETNIKVFEKKVKEIILKN